MSLVFAVGFLVAGPAVGGAPAETAADQIQSLRQEVDQLTHECEYLLDRMEQRVANLETRLLELERENEALKRELGVVAAAAEEELGEVEEISLVRSMWRPEAATTAERPCPSTEESTAGVLDLLGHAPSAYLREYGVAMLGTANDVAADLLRRAAGYLVSAEVPAEVPAGPAATEAPEDCPPAEEPVEEYAEDLWYGDEPYEYEEYEYEYEPEAYGDEMPEYYGESPEYYEDEYYEESELFEHGEDDEATEYRWPPEGYEPPDECPFEEVPKADAIDEVISSLEVPPPEEDLEAIEAIEYDPFAEPPAPPAAPELLEMPELR
jgi:hypothetical protein